MIARVAAIEQFSEDNFLLKLKTEQEFNFKAGQFVMLKINGHEKPFSISSEPGHETLDFLIKEHDGGEVTPILMEMKKGDKLEIEGPYGNYFVRETKAKEIYFIATGTGVAPFRAMIIDALKKFPDKKIILIFGFRYDFYYEKLWKQLKKKYKNFEYHASSSRAEEANWKGMCGRITEHLNEIIKDAKDKEVYVCGGESVVECVKEQLINQLKFKKEQIHVEEWREAKLDVRGAIAIAR